MNDNNSWGKTSFIEENWTHSAEKNSQPGAKNNTIFRLSWKCLNRIIIKTFYKHLVCFEHQNHVILFKVLFNNKSVEKNINTQKPP